MFPLCTPVRVRQPELFEYEKNILPVVDDSGILWCFNIKFFLQKCGVKAKQLEGRQERLQSQLILRLVN